MCSIITSISFSRRAFGPANATRGPTEQSKQRTNLFILASLGVEDTDVYSLHNHIIYSNVANQPEPGFPAISWICRFGFLFFILQITSTVTTANGVIAQKSKKP